MSSGGVTRCQTCGQIDPRHDGHLPVAGRSDQRERPATPTPAAIGGPPQIEELPAGEEPADDGDADDEAAGGEQG